MVKFKIGQIVRYDEGSTALMRIKAVSINHGVEGDNRYFGRQCMGGGMARYEDDISEASQEDIDIYIKNEGIDHSETFPPIIRKYRRMGSFKVSMTLAEQDPVGVCDMLRALKIIIIRAEYDIVTDNINYVGMCDKFDEVRECEAIREYVIKCTRLTKDSATTYQIV